MIKSAIKQKKLTLGSAPNGNHEVYYARQKAFCRQKKVMRCFLMKAELETSKGKKYCIASLQTCQ